METLTGLLTSIDLTTIAGWVTIALLALVIMAIVWILRALARRAPARRRDDGSRLAIVDAAVLTEGSLERRLVLVRRDQTEHLLLIGGSSDIVIEANIGARPSEVAISGAIKPSEPRMDDRPPPAMTQSPAASPAPPEPIPAPRADPVVERPKPAPAPRPEQLVVPGPDQRQPEPAPSAPSIHPVQSASATPVPRVAPVSSVAPDKPAASDDLRKLLNDLETASNRMDAPDTKS